jgi:hypothetical protein
MFRWFCIWGLVWCGITFSYPCSYLSDTDYYDSGWVTSASDETSCCNYCSTAQSCRCGVYSQGECFIKMNTSSLRTLDGPVACTPLCSFVSNTDFGDSGTVTSAANQDDCCNQCSVLSTCVVAVYYQSKCYLKNSRNLPLFKSGRVGCLKKDYPPISNLWSYQERFGSTHWAGCYYLTTQPFLIDGAQSIFSMGARIIKLFFAPLTIQSAYPFNSNWNGCCTSPLQLAQHPYFTTVFDMNFSIYVLVAYSGVNSSYNYWTEGITLSQQQTETQQFYDLTEYFLLTYPNKTFILQNWEGDWSLRGGNYNVKDYPSSATNQNMILWLQARQNGVTNAREDYRSKDQKGNVFLAAEVNLVSDAMAGNPDMINEVVPYVALDLISYSSYDTEQTAQFGEAINYIAGKQNKTNATPTASVVIGEYGLAQNQVSESLFQSTVQNVVSSCLYSPHCW